MARRAMTRLERAAASVNSTVAGYRMGRDGNPYVVFRDNANGRTTQIPLPANRGGSGSSGG